MAKMSKMQAEVDALYEQEFSDEKASESDEKKLFRAIREGWSAFSDTDIRQVSKVRFPLDSTLFMIFVAIVCGAKSFGQIRDFGVGNVDWFANFIEMGEGVPSDDTFRQVVNIFRPAVLQEMFQAVISGLQAESEGNHLALDGKAVRGFFASKSGRILHSVSLWNSDGPNDDDQRGGQGRGRSPGHSNTFEKQKKVFSNQSCFQKIKSSQTHE